MAFCWASPSAATNTALWLGTRRNEGCFACLDAKSFGALKTLRTSSFKREMAFGIYFLVGMNSAPRVRFRCHPSKRSREWPRLHARDNIRVIDVSAAQVSRDDFWYYIGEIEHLLERSSFALVVVYDLEFNKNRRRSHTKRCSFEDSSGVLHYDIPVINQKIGQLLELPDKRPGRTLVVLGRGLSNQLLFDAWLPDVEL